MAKSELCEGLWFADLFGDGYDDHKTTLPSGTLRKQPKLHGEKNDCAFVEKDAHGSWQRRSQGSTKETKPLKIKIGSDVYRC
jgi:hypothetical protein